MIDPNKKKQAIQPCEEFNEIDIEDSIEVPFEEYENLFFVPSEDEIEEACEVARFYSDY